MEKKEKLAIFRECSRQLIEFFKETERKKEEKIQKKKNRDTEKNERAAAIYYYKKYFDQRSSKELVEDLVCGNYTSAAYSYSIYDNDMLQKVKTEIDLLIERVTEITKEKRIMTDEKIWSLFKNRKCDSESDDELPFYEKDVS